ncbi:MAG: metal-dependent hydrolase [Methanomicrobiales archaeon]|nr:metal-dependent hydrolase [Methanomicrobiales archaeon]
MYLEHIIYSIAFALLAGLVALKHNRKDYSWIIILFTYAPDMDVGIRIGANVSQIFLGIAFPISGALHYLLHTLGALVIFAVIAGLILYAFGIPLLAGFLFSGTAYGIHLFGDFLAYRPGYSFLWPFSSEPLGIGIFGDQYPLNFFRIANSTALLVGLLFLMNMIILHHYMTHRIPTD